MERSLNEFVEKLKAAAGSNLKSVVLYGSAAAGDFVSSRSDLNLICVLEQAGADDLKKLHTALAWWAKQGQRPPLLFARSEIVRTLDVFAIEWLDIQSHRRVLFGEDPVAGLQVPMDLHRVEVERELRTQLLHLRQSFAMQRNGREALALLANSISTFATLFRHVRMALGETPAATKREDIERLAARFGFDAGPFLAIFEIREGRSAGGDAAALFEGYQAGITRVVDEVDRLFQQSK